MIGRAPSIYKRCRCPTDDQEIVDNTIAAIVVSATNYKGIKSANYHLRNIGKIRKFLNTDTTKSAIVSLVTSRLDYCNGLLCGITDELLCRLQKVQNNAARVVSGSKKYDHITLGMSSIDAKSMHR